MIFHDKSGRPLRAGDYIIYVIGGSTPDLKYAKVTGIKETKTAGYRAEERIQIKLRVRSCDYYKGSEEWTRPNGSIIPARAPRAVLGARDSLLEYSERVLCISGDQMPEVVLSELASFQLTKTQT